MINEDARDPIDGFLADPDVSPHIAFVRRVPAAEARWAELPGRLDDGLRAALRSRGVERLYSHQRAAWDAVEAGEDVVVVTPTASGKTLCYNLPVAVITSYSIHYTKLYDYDLQWLVFCRVMDCWQTNVISRC